MYIFQSDRTYFKFIQKIVLVLCSYFCMKLKCNLEYKIEFINMMQMSAVRQVLLNNLLAVLFVMLQYYM